jgi:hypothetical protein
MNFGIETNEKDPLFECEAKTEPREHERTAARTNQREKIFLARMFSSGNLSWIERLRDPGLLQLLPKEM